MGIPTTAATSRVVVQAPRAARIVWGLSGANLALVIGMLLLIYLVSERHWLGAVVTYLPRAPWAIPSVVLFVAALWWHRPSLWLNVMAGALVVGPLMDLRAPGFSRPILAASSNGQAELRIVTANVQAYKPNFADLMREIQTHKPDVVAFQEARGSHPLLADAFPDWHRLHYDYYWVASRYPIKELTRCEVQSFERTSGLIVEIATPQGPVVLADLHHMTARRGLAALTKRSFLTGEAASAITDFQQLRDAEAGELRTFVEQSRQDRPLIVVGDFNTPTSSSLFQQHWGDLQSAFDLAGTGYGYTSPVKTHNYWIDYTPWARIDHILCSGEWTVRECQIGRGQGSDHHLVFARLAR